MNYVDLPANEVPTFTLDISKTKRELHWSPKTDMGSGLVMTKHWIQETFLQNKARRNIS